MSRHCNARKPAMIAIHPAVKVISTRMNKEPKKGTTGKENEPTCIAEHPNNQKKPTNKRQFAL